MIIDPLFHERRGRVFLPQASLRTPEGIQWMLLIQKHMLIHRMTYHHDTKMIEYVGLSNQFEVPIDFGETLTYQPVFIPGDDLDTLDNELKDSLRFERVDKTTRPRDPSYVRFSVYLYKSVRIFNN